MEEVEVKEDKAIEKPTYDQLNSYVNELAIENRKLRNKLVQVMDVQNKLPYLFQVLANKSFFSEDVLNTASNEIVYILFPPQEETDEGKDNQDK